MTFHGFFYNSNGECRIYTIADDNSNSNPNRSYLSVLTQGLSSNSITEESSNNRSNNAVSTSQFFRYGNNIFPGDLNRSQTSIGAGIQNTNSQTDYDHIYNNNNANSLTVNGALTNFNNSVASQHNSRRALITRRHRLHPYPISSRRSQREEHLTNEQRPQHEQFGAVPTGIVEQSAMQLDNVEDAPPSYYSI